MSSQGKPETTIRIGQKWREVDRRFSDLPIRSVVGFEPDGRVRLGRPDGKVSKCNPRRFHGKNGGYELVEDAP